MNCRAADRFMSAADGHNNTIGFRVSIILD